MQSQQLRDPIFCTSLFRGPVTFPFVHGRLRDREEESLDLDPLAVDHAGRGQDSFDRGSGHSMDCDSVFGVRHGRGSYRILVVVGPGVYRDLYPGVAADPCLLEAMGRDRGLCSPLDHRHHAWEGHSDHCMRECTCRYPFAPGQRTLVVVLSVCRPVLQSHYERH